MKRRYRFVPVILLMLLYVCCTFHALHAEEPDPFPSVTRDYDWSFPADHGAHPSYRTEWWYFSGIVSSDDHEFGFQFTVFRQRTKQQPRAGSDWFTNQVYLGHMAVSDLRNETHHATTQVARGHLELGFSPDTMPGTIRVRNWTCSFEEGWRIKARKNGIELNMTLDPDRPVLFQGPNGYSVKGPGDGQASLYYSQTRLRTSGTLTLENSTHEVSGRTWFDHEFGSSQLSENQEGWDWISLRLSDGSDLMVYRLRETGGQVSPQSSATLRHPDGSVTYLKQADWNMTPRAYWTSPETGARYPVRWRFTGRGSDIDLIVDRRFDRQEMVLEGGLTAPYWEGVVRATGTRDGSSVTGRGFLEMTGYVESLDGAF